ncbi:hypothetical protein [Streptomyces xanthochromogenes]
MSRLVVLPSVKSELDQMITPSAMGVRTPDHLPARVPELLG